MTTEKEPRRVGTTIFFPSLTVEVALWGLLLTIALGLRLLRLDAAPLDAVEARGTLAAWRFSQGLPTGGDYSPALFLGQWLTFALLGAGDVAARFWPALAGTALVLTPALLRAPLGRLGALFAGALLALSPTALLLSRTASGHILTALGALLFLAGLWRMGKSTESTKSTKSTKLAETRYAALALALILVSGPLAYSALLTLALAFVALLLVDPGRWLAFRRKWIAWRATPGLALHGVGTLAVAFVLFGTALAWHLEGLGAAADLLSQWLGGFVRWPDSPSLSYPIQVLILYEPLILLLGGVGLLLVVIRPFSSGERRVASQFLALWGLAALILALIRPGHGPGDVLIILLPLACLGGLAFERLVEALRRWGDWLVEGLYVVVSAPLWAYFLINLWTLGNRFGQFTPLNLLFFQISWSAYLGMLLLSLFLLLAITVILGLVQGPEPALRGLLLSTAGALLLFTVSTAVGLTQNRTDDPRELLVVAPTSGQVRLLKQDLVRLSYEHAGGAYAIDGTVLVDDPALAWELRDFQKISFGTGAPLPTSVVIAPHVSFVDLAGDYTGQVFALRRRWRPDGLTCRAQQVQSGEDQLLQIDCGALARWLVFRRSAEPPAEEQVVLWVRQDLVGW